jgi:serine/threonine protein phosphatase 1
MDSPYTIPEGIRVYAIGDIHGYADVLARMHDLIDEDLTRNVIDTAMIVYIGDYIDRGPDSKGVIDLLCHRRESAPHIKHIFLMGNHENGMLEFMREPEGRRKDWLAWGGVEALQSYGIKVDKHKDLAGQSTQLAEKLLEALPDKHMEFLKTLDLKYELGGYFFAHAGVHPEFPLEEQTKQDLIMIREPFLSWEKLHEKRIVHGHTIMKNMKIDIRPNRINLDSGLYSGGPLTCAVLEGGDVRVIEVWQDI